jgi:DNA polymerase-2
MEAARSDYTDLAKRFQRELLTLFFEDSTPKELEFYVREITASLVSGDLDSELIYHKVLRRPAQDYGGSAPPQVRAARLLGWTHQKGRISYLMTKAGPEPLEKISSPVDYRHYIDHQLRPIWQSLADAADIGETFLQPSMSETPLSSEHELKTGEQPMRGEAFSRLSPLDDQLELDF